MKHTEEYKWHYHRTNSKGKKIFRHYTQEDIEDVLGYLDERGFYYEIAGGGMLWITNKNNDTFSYYWTTGKWSCYKDNRKKHYQAMGIKDFLDRYIDNDEYLKEQEATYQNAVEAKAKEDEKIEQHILNILEGRGEIGLTSRQLKDDHAGEWGEERVGWIPRQLELKGLIFYRGDKIGRARVMRLTKYKEDKNESTARA